MPRQYPSQSMRTRMQTSAASTRTANWVACPKCSRIVAPAMLVSRQVRISVANVCLLLGMHANIDIAGGINIHELVKLQDF